MNKTIITLCALLVLSFTVHSEWVYINSGTVQNLNSVYFINQQTGFIAGNGSALRKTTDGGANWTAVDPFGALEIRSVFFADANTGYICGASGMIAKSTSGGLNWNTQSSGTSNTLFSVSFANSSVGVCCGNSGTTLYTTNGGANWVVGSPTGYLVTFYTSFMLNASTGYCAGVNTIFSPLLAKTTNGGANWIYSSFMVNNNEATLWGIHYFNDQNGVAVSNLWNSQGGVSRTTNGGTNWTHQIFPLGFLCLDFPTSATGYSAGLGGTMMKSTDGGVSWNPQISGTSVNLRSVYFADSLHGYAAGEGGTVLKTTNGGVTGFEGKSYEIPDKFMLYQNYPNPFNPTSKIRYQIQTPSVVKLVIFDIFGREIAVLVNQKQPAGTYEIEWDGINHSSGVYFYKLAAGDPSTGSGLRYSDTKKMVLIK